MLELLRVNPPEYYPIIDKLFAGRLREALEAFGASLEELTVFVQPEDRVFNLVFFLKVRNLTRFFSVDVDSFIYGLLEKLASDATSTFGRLYNVRFSIAGFRVSEEEPEEETHKKAKLIVNGPLDMEEALERLGKGLMITLREWGVPFSSLAITATSESIPRIRVVLKLEKILPAEEKARLTEKMREKAKTYLKTLTKKLLPIEIKIIDPEDKALALVMRKKEEIEREAEELAEKAEVRELMNLLGKGIPGS